MALKVQSFYGHSLLYEHFTARDVISGYPISSFKLSKDHDIKITSVTVVSLVLISSLLAVCNITTTFQTASIGVFAFVLYFLCTSPCTSESVIAVGGVGIQIGNECKWWRGRGSTFIPLSKINDVIINEAIYRHSIMYYLALLTNDEGTIKIVPLFTTQKPKLATIQSIYKSLKSTLNYQMM